MGRSPHDRAPRPGLRCSTSLPTPTEESLMPKVSKETAEKFEDWGPAGKEVSQALDGTLHVSFVEVAEDADLSPMLFGLPNDECQCSHWGYVLEGRIWH